MPDISGTKVAVSGYIAESYIALSYIALSASPTHLLLEVGWLTKPLYTVQFDFGGFQRLQFL